MVVITDTFPFGSSESFIEIEILHYSGFDRVYIIPLTCDKPMRSIQLPANVQVLKLPPIGKIERLLWFAWALLKLPFWNEVGFLLSKRKFALGRLKCALSFVGYGEAYCNRALTELRKVVNRDDKLYFYGYWLLLPAYIAIGLNKMLGEQCIARCHGGDLYEYTSENASLPLRDYLLRNLKKVFCISQDGVEYIKQSYPKHAKRALLSRLGTIDHGVRIVDLKRKPLQVVSCSWLVPDKRMLLMIDVLSNFTGNEVEWTHYGDGPQECEVYQYAHTRLHGKIKWHLRGAMSNNELMREYSEKDFHLFLSVSKTEGLPVSMMEAISYGIPILATNVGGVMEIVHKGENGYCLDKEFDIGQAVSCIRSFAQMDDITYLHFREKARAHWETSFDANKNYANFIQMMIREANKG